MELCLSLDDVLLVPKFNPISSRLDTDLRTRLTKEIYIEIPILSASMDTVTGFEMASKMAELGGAGFLHRFAPDEEIVNWVRELVCRKQIAVPSIGIREDIGRWVGLLLEIGASAISIDIAHGHSLSVLKTVELLVDLFPEIQLIGGNVATAEGTRDLINAGVSAVKINIGPGSHCTTRLVTGFGIPTFTAACNCAQEARKHDIPIIADGGMKVSGDFVKYLAIGAESCMTGFLLAASEEAPGEIIKVGSNLYKSYRGLASIEAQEAFKGGLRKGTAAEGEATVVPYKGPVEPIIEGICGGIRSGLTYCGARNLQELREKAEFIRITHSGMIEGTPHGVSK